jgi:hypothetical protein
MRFASQTREQEFCTPDMLFIPKYLIEIMICDCSQYTTPNQSRKSAKAINELIPIVPPPTILLVRISN